MNETKQVWKDVAAILQKGGWPTGDESAAPFESGGVSVWPPLPSRKEPTFYRWLPAGAITSMVVCLLALFLTARFGGLTPEKNIVEDMRKQLTQTQQRLDALAAEQTKGDKALHEAEQSLSAAITTMDRTSASLTAIQQSVKDLREEQRGVKEELKTTLKSLRHFQDRLKQEQDQRIRAIEDIQKRLSRKPVEFEKQSPSKK